MKRPLDPNYPHIDRALQKWSALYERQRDLERQLAKITKNQETAWAALKQSEIDFPVEYAAKVEASAEAEERMKKAQEEIAKSIAV